MSTLDERLDNAMPAPNRAQVYVWFDSLTAKDRETIMARVLNSQYKNPWFVTFFAAEGIPTSKDTVALWRRSLGFTR